MKVVKPMKLPILHRVREVGRRPQLELAAMIGFPIDDSRKILGELDFWAATTKELGETGILDEGFAKTRGEMLVCGSFHAPDGKAIPASFVRARVGSLDKRLAVIGDRDWNDGGPTAPKPMTTMPIDWAHAFGGPNFDRNPFGKGRSEVETDRARTHPLPNVEHYDRLLRHPDDEPEPAGFMPMNVQFAQRRARAGTYDRRWFEETFPSLPADADPGFYNAAPPDQWQGSFFRGDEEIEIEHMHPERAKLAGSLPGLRARGFVTKRARGGDETFVEIPLACDTVWLFPGSNLGVVIFHGVVPVREDDAEDVLHLVCGCEALGDEARPASHYQAAMRRRLDKDKGAIAEISDGDLMPPRASGVAPNLDGLQMGKWLRSEGLLTKNERRGHERHLARHRERLAAEGIDPDKHGPGPLPPPVEEPPLDDLDALAAYMEAQTAAVEAAERDAEIAAREAAERARALRAEMGEEQSGEEREEEKKKALAEAAGPPKFRAAAQLAAMQALAAEARRDGAPIVELESMVADPAYLARLESQERDLLASYRAGVHLQESTGPAADDVREAMRDAVARAVAAGASLAGRDLTGASLRGVSLAGVDLGGAFLESADLVDCDLTGANLEGAVLAHADLGDAKLARASLRGANLGHADLRDADLTDACLADAVLMRAKLEGARLRGADARGADWMEVSLAGVDLEDAQLGDCNLLRVDLTGARFVGAELAGANFVECTLEGADFARADLHKATFVTCKGGGVIFRGARASQAVFVHGCELPGADFREAKLEKANFRGASLDAARFDGADIEGGDLSSCHARGASFDRAVLRGGLAIRIDLERASLRSADLRDVLMSKSRIMSADFSGANLHRADLSRAIRDEATRFTGAEMAQLRVLPTADLSSAHGPEGGGDS